MNETPTDPQATHLPAHNLVTLDISPDAFQQLERLRQRSGDKPLEELFRAALSTYDWYLESTANGAQLGVVSPDDPTVIRLVTLRF